MSDAIIQVDDVSKSYGGVKANVDISLQVKRGSITGRKSRICGSVTSPASACCGPSSRPASTAR